MRDVTKELRAAAKTLVKDTAKSGTEVSEKTFTRVQARHEVREGQPGVSHGGVSMMDNVKLLNQTRLFRNVKKKKCGLYRFLIDQKLI